MEKRGNMHPPGKQNNGGKRSRRHLGTALIYLSGCCIALVTAYPVFYAAAFGLKGMGEARTSPSYALPREIDWGNYLYIIKESSFPRYFVNSMIITGTVVILVLILASMAAFALAKMQLRGKHRIQMYFLMGLMIPIQVCLLPLYQAFAGLHLTNSYFGVILPQAAFGIPLSMYLFLNFFRFFPDDILEACVIDGAGICRLFVGIVLPMSRNIILTLAMMRAVYSWNDFLFPYTFTRSRDLQTITLGLRDFVGAYGYTDWGRTFAAVTITIVPMIAVYFFLGKYMVSGMADGSVKG